MPVTKITLSTAMRARDVSRPREEYLAEAVGREETVTRQAPAPPKPAPPANQPPPANQLPPAEAPRRRRRRGR
jgi:hypothetical protein